MRFRGRKGVKTKAFGDWRRVRPARRRTAAAVAVAIFAALAGAATAAPDPERYDATPTGWGWYSQTTEAVLNAFLGGNRMRLVDIEVVKPKPHRFAAAMVHNNGVFARPSWHWYYGLTVNALTNLPQITSGQERVLDIESYKRSGKRRYAVVTVSNEGDSAKAWWWYLGASKSYIANHLKGRRIIDLDPRPGSSKYDVVMLRNKGEDNRAWWYYYRRTPAQIKSLLQQNKARLVDIEADGAGKFTVVMVRRSGEYWWWYYGKKAVQVGELVAQHGARIIDIERYQTAAGKNRYAVILLNNLDPLSTKVRQIMKPGVQKAAFGFYLKQVGGPVYAGLQTQKVFEPASMLKVVHHLHAMRSVQAGQASLGESITWYAHPNNPARYPSDPNYAEGSKDKNKCAYESDGDAITSNPYTDPLGEVILRQMMEQSDNRTTDAVVDRFGLAALNSTALNAVGMTKTKVNHRIGCPHKASVQPYKSNEMTLHDAGLLYEGVADGSLLGNSTFRDVFYEYMLNSVSGWKKVVDEEAASLGKSQTIADQFLAQMRTAVKGGSYTSTRDCPSGTSGVCRLLRRTGFGVLYLPFKTAATGAVTKRAYVYGSFVDGLFSCGASKVVDGKETACNDEETKIGEVRSAAHRTMLRPRIREALMTW